MFYMSEPLAKRLTQLELGLNMLLRQIEAAMFLWTMLLHSELKRLPALMREARFKAQSRRKARVTARTYQKRELLRWRVGLKPASAEGLPAMRSSFSPFFFRWFMQMLPISKEVLLMLTCPKSSSSYAMELPESWTRLKLESSRLMMRLSSLNMDAYCFSEVSPAGCMDWRDCSLRRWEAVLSALKRQIMPQIQEMFSILQNCLIYSFHMLTRPLQSDSFENSISAKHTPTISSSFKIFLKDASSLGWIQAIEAEAQSMMRLLSRALEFLKKRVRRLTPKESMYLMRVGNSGMMLYFLRQEIDSSSKLNSSDPIFLVQPSRLPNQSMRMTWFSDYIFSRMPAMRKVLKSLMIQLQPMPTSCRWKSLLQAQNLKCLSLLDSLFAQFYTNYSRFQSWKGFTLKGMISLMERPIKLLDSQPSTLGKFFDIFTTFPISSSTLMQITADLSLKSLYFISFWLPSQTCSAVHFSASLIKLESLQRLLQVRISKIRESVEYSLVSKSCLTTLLFSMSKPISVLTAFARTWFLPSFICVNFRMETLSSQAIRKFYIHFTIFSSNSITSLAQHILAPPLFSFQSEEHLDLRISIQRRFLWLLFFLPKNMRSLKLLANIPLLYSRFLIAFMPQSSSEGQSYSQAGLECSILVLIKKSIIMAANMRVQYCPLLKQEMSKPKEATNAAISMNLLNFWQKALKKGMQKVRTTLSKVATMPTICAVRPEVMFRTRRPTSTMPSSTK